MEKKTLFHRIYGMTPGVGVQPKEAMAYGLAGFGQNFICTIIGSYLTIFMTDALLFGADGVKIGSIAGSTAVAYLMLGTRIFDAMNDPIMGSIVDKTRTKWGKCRPYLKWTAFPIAIFTLLCFAPFYQSKAVWTFAMLSATYVIWSVVYTVCDVPYWALSTNLTNNTEVRANILTVTRLVCTLGAGIVTVGVPIITSAVTAKYKFTDSQEHIAQIMQTFSVSAEDAAGYVGTVMPEFVQQNADTLKVTYFICAAVFVVLAIPMFFYGFKHTQERFSTGDDAPSFGHNIKLLFKNDQLLLIVLSGVLGGARMVYTYTGGLYFAKYALKNENLYSIITLLVVPGGLIASLLVPYLSKKFTKKKTYIFVHLLGGVTMLVMWLVGYDATRKLLVAAVCLVILGIPQGVNNIITYAMIGDTVEYLEWKTGERGEGICFAMQTLINKIGMAVGAFIGVMSYGIAGINPEATDGNFIQSPDRLWNVLVLTGVISMFACAVPMFFYKITEDRQREMVAEIEQRRASQASK